MRSAGRALALPGTIQPGGALALEVLRFLMYNSIILALPVHFGALGVFCRVLSVVECDLSGRYI